MFLICYSLPSCDVFLYVCGCKITINIWKRQGNMNKICIINDNLLFVVVFMHEICRINIQIMHVVVFEGGNKRYFWDFLHFSCLKLAVLNFFCLFLQQLIFKPVINKLTMNLLILLVIPCILYGRSFNVMDFGAQGNHIIETKILNRCNKVVLPLHPNIT